MSSNSQLTFKDLCDSQFGGFVKVVWNNKTIFEDTDDGPYIEGNLITENFDAAWKKFEEKYGKKSIDAFCCDVVDFHHTAVYIEGEDV